jgi:hypothetical protein
VCVWSLCIWACVCLWHSLGVVIFGHGWRLYTKQAVGKYTSTRLLTTLSGVHLQMVGETDESMWQTWGFKPKPTAYSSPGTCACEKVVSLARSSCWTPLDIHSPDTTSPSSPTTGSESREARITPANGTLGSPPRPVVPTSPQCRCKLPGTVSSASPHIWGWRSVSQDVDLVPRPWRIRGCRVSQTKDFQAETAAGTGDDPRAQLGASPPRPCCGQRSVRDGRDGAKTVPHGFGRAASGDRLEADINH